MLKVELVLTPFSPVGDLVYSNASRPSDHLGGVDTVCLAI